MLMGLLIDLGFGMATLMGLNIALAVLTQIAAMRMLKADPAARLAAAA